MIADRQTHRQTDTLITILRFPIAGGVTSCYNRLTARGRTAAVLGLPYVRVSPDTSSFLAFVRAPGQVFENRRFVRVFGRIRKYIRTLPTAKAYDGMRQRKLVIQYKKGKEFFLYNTISSICHAETFTHTYRCSQPKLLKAIRSSV